jgi:transposase
MLANALGRPLRFIVTAGQVGEITQAPALLNGQTDQAFWAIKRMNSNALRATIVRMEAEAVIPLNPSRKSRDSVVPAGHLSARPDHADLPRNHHGSVRHVSEHLSAMYQGRWGDARHGRGISNAAMSPQDLDD